MFSKDFKETILDSKATDLALGTLLGMGVTPVANSLIQDVVMPPLGLALGQADLPNQFFLLQEGKRGGPYKSLKEAQEDGATTINYGKLINHSFSLIIVLGVTYYVIKAIDKISSSATAGETATAMKSFLKEQPSFKK